jgi:hypothetical protein
MPKYFVRVELRGDPALAVYLKLHAFLRTKGFLTEVDGQELPHATYFGPSEMSANELSGKLSDEIRLETQFDALVAVAETQHVSVNGRTGAPSFAEALSAYAASEEYRSAPWINHLAGLGTLPR